MAKKKNIKNRKAVFLLKFFGFSFLFLFFISLSVFIFYAKDLPRPEKFTEKQFVQSTKIFDRTGEVLLYEIYGEEKRTLVPLADISENIKHAVIATEDANFYSHFGIDLGGILRSILINLEIKKSASFVGASTIPQQLIRSTFLTLEKTIERKFREVVLALELDRRYSKDEILGWYLNQVPFGSNCYGVEAASQTFFQKPSSKLSVAQAAALTALIQAPSYLSPYGKYKEKLLERKDYVLERMRQENYLTDQELEEAKKEVLVFELTQAIKAPHFVIHIIEDYLKPKYGQDLSFLKQNGLNIYTSLDWELQEQAEEIVRAGVKANNGYNAYNGALTAIDPENGNILAMVGSADWFGESYPPDCISGVNCLFDPKFNVAIGTETSFGRQPGSAFKPFVYATAFEKNYDDKTTVVDEETNFGLWGDKEYIPKNYDGLFRGEVTLRQGLAQSLNVPSVKVLMNLAGLADSVQTAKALGLTTLKGPFGPSIVLGGWEVKLLDMTSAYGVFAANGLRVSPVAILKIEDYNGNIIEENKKTAKRIISIKAASLINDILSDNDARAPMFGYYSPLYFYDYKISAKTGTTQDFKDAWTLGYSSSIVTGVWVGNNNNASMAEKPAVVLAGPIFHSFMEKALQKYPPK